MTKNLKEHMRDQSTSSNHHQLNSLPNILKIDKI